jgi:hypothetical protein
MLIEFYFWIEIFKINNKINMISLIYRIYGIYKRRITITIIKFIEVEYVDNELIGILYRVQSELIEKNSYY